MLIKPREKSFTVKFYLTAQSAQSVQLLCQMSFYCSIAKPDGYHSLQFLWSILKSPNTIG